jgi:predicted metal-dependent hydrolase
MANMSSDDFERRFQHHVEFMIEQQAKFEQRQAEFEERHAKFAKELAELREAQTIQTENINRLYDLVTADRKTTRYAIDALITEMREGFDNLIVANEVTRELAENVARLAVQTSQRVTELEKKPS